MSHCIYYRVYKAEHDIGGMLPDLQAHTFSYRRQLLLQEQISPAARSQECLEKLEYGGLHPLSARGLLAFSFASQGLAAGHP